MYSLKFLELKEIEMCFQIILLKVALESKSSYTQRPIQIRRTMLYINRVVSALCVLFVLRRNKNRDAH